MTDKAGAEDVDVEDIAQYVSDVSRQLAVMARDAGLVTVAAGLEQAHRAAAAEARALQSTAGNAAPDDAT